MDGNERMNGNVPADLVQTAWEKALQGKPLTRRESEMVFQAFGVRVSAELPDVAENLERKAAAVSQKIEHTVGSAPVAPEALAEDGRIRKAVEQALEMGIVREEVMPSNVSGARSAYILSSAHYDLYNFNPDTTQPHLKESQAQLFRLAHLLEKHGVQSPLFVEGKAYGRHYGTNSFCTHLASGGRNVLSPKMQQELFQDPQKIVQLFDEYQRFASTHRMSTPSFYALTSYPNIQGAHTLQTHEAIKQHLEVWMSWYKDFQKKYEDFNRSLTPGKRCQVTVGTGWDPSGKPLVSLAGKWIYVDDFSKDCDNLVRFGEESRAFDARREQDVARLMLSAPSSQVPMAYMGLGHTLQVAALLKERTVHVLTPQASATEKYDALRARHLLPPLEANHYNQQIFLDIQRKGKAIPWKKR